MLIFTKFEMRAPRLPMRVKLPPFQFWDLNDVMLPRLPMRIKTQPSFSRNWQEHGQLPDPTYEVETLGLVSSPFVEVMAPRLPEELKQTYLHTSCLKSRHQTTYEGETLLLVLRTASRLSFAPRLPMRN